MDNQSLCYEKLAFDVMHNERESASNSHNAGHS